MSLISVLKGSVPLEIRIAARRRMSRARYRLDRLRYKREAAGLPIPPPEENFLVSGTEDVRWYVEGGKLAKYSITFALARNLIDIKDFGAILDFGCGSGRVIRYWKGLGAEVHGTDYNPRLIEWCKSNLTFAHFQTNRPLPPLDYGDQTFDLIYALSVFTHLDEAAQLSWRDELARVLKPGGYLIITTHGDCRWYQQGLTESQRERFRAGEMVVVRDQQVGSNECAAFHPVGYVREKLAEGFEVVDFLRGGSLGTPYQDLWLLRKSSPAEGPGS